MLVAYVSGHGFGHATRTAEVLRAVRALDPRRPITIVSSAPAELFESALAGPLRIRRLACDVGLAQRDALAIDEPETARAWQAFARGFEALLDAEIRFLKSGARVVLGDIPPLAFAAAYEAGVPSVGLANFSWDWIYRHLSARQPALLDAAERCARAYRLCGLLLQLPFAADLSAFPRREPIPLVARRPRVSRIETRRRLGLRSGTVVLLSFGGIGLQGLDPASLAPLRHCHFVQVGERAGVTAGPGLPENLTWIERAALARSGLGYEDVVGAADVVVTKPGYGIVSDAIGAGTPVVYTDRGDFPEFPILVEGMKTCLACAYLSNADLLAGRMGEAIERALSAPRPEPPDLSGAEVAARRILA